MDELLRVKIPKLLLDVAKTRILRRDQEPRRLAEIAICCQHGGASVTLLKEAAGCLAGARMVRGAILALDWAAEAMDGWEEAISEANRAIEWFYDSTKEKM